jgi:orotidine-5'-phosphate decarboxylase
MARSSKTYGARAESHKHPLAKQFLELIERKQSNLALSIDVTKSAELLRIVEAAAPYLCMVKVSLTILTHFCDGAEHFSTDAH